MDIRLSSKAREQVLQGKPRQGGISGQGKQGPRLPGKKTRVHQPTLRCQTCNGEVKGRPPRCKRCPERLPEGLRVFLGKESAG